MGIGFKRFCRAVARSLSKIQVERLRERGGDGSPPPRKAAFDAGPPLACIFVVLLVAGHPGCFGAHASDSIAKDAAAGSDKPSADQPKKQPGEAGKTDPAQVKVFTEIIRPILRNHCVACHGPDKSKGKLRLDSYEAILKGGNSGPAIVSGKPGESGLIKRVHLALTEEDHMPPADKPQPALDDLALVEWWVETGAPENRKAGELEQPPAIARILDARFGCVVPVAKAVPPKPLNEVQPVANRLADELGIVITALAPNEPWLQCNASVAGTNFGDAELVRLSLLSANLRWLDLGGTRVSDSGLSNCVAMANLVRLHLERTAISDTGLASLAGLPGLEYLNLYATRITDAGLAPLRRLPKLKQLYLWQTQVTPAAAAQFAESRPEVDEIRKWQVEIERLRAQIREARVTVDVGMPADQTKNPPAK